MLLKLNLTDVIVGDSFCLVILLKDIATNLKENLFSHITINMINSQSPWFIYNINMNSYIPFLTA